MLKSGNPRTREDAVEKLGARGEVRLVGTLAFMTRDPDAGVRAAAVTALSKLNSPLIFKTLEATLNDAAPVVREASVGGLSRNKEMAAKDLLLAALCQALCDPNAGVRLKALQSLESRGWQPQNDIQRVGREMARGQFLKAAALGAVAIEPLVGVLQSNKIADRQAAAEALGHIGDVRVFRPLLGAFADEAPNVRTAAAEALGRAGDSRLVDPLLKGLQDKDRHVRVTTVEALGRLGTAQVIEPLVAVLQDPAWDVRASSAKALGRFHDPRVVEPLVGLLADKDHDVRRSAVEALGHAGDPRALVPLILMLKDEHASVRAAAPGALNRIDREWERNPAAKEAIPQLKAALGNREYWVRQAAQQTIQRIAQECPEQPSLSHFAAPDDIKRRRAREALLEAMADSDRDVRQAAAEALGRIGDPLAAGALAGSLNDSDCWVGVAVARSLEMLQWQPSDEVQRIRFASLIEEVAS